MVPLAESGKVRCLTVTFVVSRTAHASLIS